MKIQLTHSFEEIISLENLLEAWKEFEKGKKNKKDVQEFSINLMDHIFTLHNELSNHTYKHGNYQAFKVNDPKPRDIHKANVRDRLLHHAIYRKLYPFFDRTFIADSYSCRINKGTHRALKQFKEYSYKVSKNNTKTCWTLQCDIKKFFANIDHEILVNILSEYIPDKDILKLLKENIDSFHTKKKKGLPLGNLTSQLFVNIYMNKFDQFVKHKLKAKYYIRYADDFVFLSKDKNLLEKYITQIGTFLEKELKLELHPQKVSINTIVSGIDFLGYITFPQHKLLRTKTKRRMFKKLSEKHANLQRGKIQKEKFEQSMQAYLGMAGHCDGWKIEVELQNRYSKLF
ncbi:MAG: reverse transcriptase/maturase family protein [Patescibacteria group bacterium]|nr:reverse transcriptase/maturase family protein [Patescibacteria group bacterium]